MLRSKIPSYVTNITRSVRSYSQRVAPPFTAGQPLFETRPFMVQPGELTPGITALEYFQRRIDLASKLPDQSLAVIVGSQVQFASGSVFYDFQQNNDLYYLSGWNEPDSVIAIEKPTSRLEDVTFHMIVPPKEPLAEQWDGFRTGVKGVVEIFNADESEDIYRLAPYMEKLINRNRNIFIDLPEGTKKQTTSTTFSNFFNIGSNAKMSSIENLLKSTSGKSIKPLSPYVSEMRLIKSSAELNVMRRAGQISGRAYNETYAKRFKTERTLKSYLEYRFVSGGCDKSAYIPVVAAGSNALCIHYTRNDDMLFEDEMVLVDASGKLGGYASDISRTWPSSGKFSLAQKELYQAVLNVEKECITKCTEDHNLSLQELHDMSVLLMRRELRNCGFGELTHRDVSKLYPHYIGHNLGLDVHDVPRSSRNSKLKAGQVITIEPGVYVPDDHAFPKGFRNIGIRIEDDIAIGKDTYRNLTVEAAKEIEDIERIAEFGVTTPNLEDEVVEVF
ncbi:hypothetical protein BN7_3824 [Wickerhamomyces ciferrii]|uniref:Aminopeptidase P N-terminal domain-containing protein n=1 Tax=Wickerhamomyces ciferrii (strain ATCC 14091 / BCRC 22168 / CBS 111 / JCM 3599 / NBRC 0793 / NRRL Y-1031 F-60-10) TaxID=1206466 RepID=K0KSH5_WICCF|nr:uncharacterized protein BN7_3824 [Wickerhamomyces ciferrii]CCH44263.1 hypothetical protein BN7_3824 [Wickerhamomyces ciferrii]